MGKWFGLERHAEEEEHFDYSNTYNLHNLDDLDQGGMVLINRYT